MNLSLIRQTDSEFGVILGKLEVNSYLMFDKDSEFIGNLETTSKFIANREIPSELKVNSKCIREKQSNFIAKLRNR